MPRRALPLLLCLSFLIAALHPAGAAEPVPIAAFFGDAAFSAPVLSPDARHLAVRVSSEPARDRLAVVNLLDNSIKVIAEFGSADVGDFQWVNNERLLYNSRDRTIAPGDAHYAPGLFAVNRDGSGFRRLANVSNRGQSSMIGSKLLPWHTFMLDQPGAQDSHMVYVSSRKYNNRGELQLVDLLRLDTLSGRATTVNRPGNTQSWLLDHKGEPRVATVLDHDVAAVHYREPGTNTWRKLVSFNAYLGGPGAFAPLGFAPDGTLYVSSDKGSDTDELRRFNLASGTVGKEALVRLDGYDFNGELIADSARLLGVRYLSDARATVWFDAGMKAVQAQVDKLRPDTVNLIDVAARAETPYVVVQSYSDRQPTLLALFNTQTGQLNPVGSTHPKIDAARMAAQDLIRYKARDGLTIPAWLTVPNGAKGKPMPMVVMVHGGPFVRGNSWGWNAEGQFLASRGYAVLEPEFRGSTGFGRRHFRAGWKQWGLAMQDDIADGVRWAIAQGIADPKRICIAGASYGGYAALMGLIRDPELYQCGINWVGVTDIKLLYTGHWSATSDMTDNWRQYGMPTLVGDLVKDAAQLEATSPLVQAAKVRQPLLLAYGSVDQRVPVYHGRKFYEAVKPTNPNVEWVVYDGEAHGWTLPSTRLDFWGRVEKFLARHLGAAASEQPAPRPAPK